MVTNNNARRLNGSCLCSSHTGTPGLVHNCRSSSTNGLRYTSMSLPGCLGPWMSTGIIMNFRFMHTKEEGYRCIDSRARCCDWSSALQKDSGHLYLDQTLSSLRHLQTLRTPCRSFSTAAHQRGVSTSRLSYAFLYVIATTWHALCF